MAFPCPICNVDIKYRFENQEIRGIVKSVFNIELNINNDAAICPLCLLLLQHCQQIFKERIVVKPPKKGHCNSCHKKSKDTIHFPMDGFPEQTMTLSYYRRLKKIGLIRMCPLCVSAIDFVPKIINFSQRNKVATSPAVSGMGANHLSSSAIALTTPGPSHHSGYTPNKFIEKNAVAVTPTGIKIRIVPPKPPPLPSTAHPVNTNAAGPSIPMVVLPEEVALALPKSPIKTPPKPSQLVAPPAPPPIANIPPKAFSTVTRPTNISPPTEVKLPQGVTWDQLNCSVELPTMCVPPIRIKDLRIQSILKSKSPEKSPKRVSFNSMAPTVFQYKDKSRINTSDTVTPGGGVESIASDDDEPLSKANENAVAQKRKTRPKPDSLPIAKRRSHRSSTSVIVSYAENYVPPNLMEAVQASPLHRCFKVHRPKKEKEQQRKRLSLPLIPPRVYRPIAPKPSSSDLLLLPSTSNYTPIVAGGVENNVEKQIANAMSSKTLSQPQPNLKRSVAPATEDTPKKQTRTDEPLANAQPQQSVSPSARSPLRRTLCRRLSMEIVAVNEGGDAVAGPSEAVSSNDPSRSPGGKIAIRRKTLDPSQISRQPYQIRVVSFEKLKADKPVDLLLHPLNPPPLMPRQFPYSGTP